MKPGDATILLYHGVTDCAPQGIENFSYKHIPVEDFDRQMRWIARNANPMRLRDMAAALAHGDTLPPRSVAVTFDDTFRNNHDVALPVLRRHGVPCTFFVTTGFVGTNRTFWVDKVERAVNESARTALTLDLGNGDEAFSLSDPAARVAAITAIKAAMKRMSPNRRDTVLRHLAAAADVDVEATSNRPNYQNLDWEQVRALDARPDYEVGGHTVNHEILAYLDQAALMEEIDGCIAALRRELAHDIDLFSYPEGQQDHYNETVIAVLQRAGITVCPSAVNGFNQAGANPFHLKRIMVGFMGTPFPFPLDDEIGR